MNANIPDFLFYNKYIPCNCKLIYMYLVSISNDNGVCLDYSKKDISEKFRFNIDGYLMILINLKLIGTYFKSNSKPNHPVPKILPIPSETEFTELGISKKIIPSKKFLSLIERWNYLFDADVIFTKGLHRSYLNISSIISEDDIRKSIENRFLSIKDSKEFKDPSKSYFKKSLEYFLSNYDFVSIWLGKNNEDEIKKFNFHEK